MKDALIKDIFELILRELWDNGYESYYSDKFIIEIIPQKSHPLEYEIKIKHKGKNIDFVCVYQKDAPMIYGWNCDDDFGDEIDLEKLFKNLKNNLQQCV